MTLYFNDATKLNFKSSYKCRKYEDYIKAQFCLVCELPPPSDPHHLYQRDNDFYTVPMCRKHHRELHDYGKEKYWDKKNIDVKRRIIELLINYIRGKYADN